MPNPPAYRTLADTLRLEIKTGVYPVGKPLPSQPALAEKYSVSKGTVGRAVALLAQEGLVRPQHARSTVVTAKPVSGAEKVHRYLHARFPAPCTREACAYRKVVAIIMRLLEEC